MLEEVMNFAPCSCVGNEIHQDVKVTAFRRITRSVRGKIVFPVSLDKNENEQAWKPVRKWFSERLMGIPKLNYDLSEWTFSGLGLRARLDRDLPQSLARWTDEVDGGIRSLEEWDESLDQRCNTSKGTSID
ncbi:hypothetical protein RRG08_009614 [Elysia crispata]|uniref:Uncharacterized protein n=1 Tax=Elysia crispata TaxID=231223 RepID=A0AAE0XUN8_9GAST|nr:hypothetical protein RRG08_009614 [Elysia crispata]